MKKNLIVIFAFLFWILGFCSADRAWYTIDNYQADFELTSGGLLKVHENIEVNFDEYRHGIYRDIPFVYPKSDYLLKTPLSNVSVENYQFSTSENGNDFRIKIWSPDFEVIGKQTYPISYEVRGSVREFTGYQELYWNMLGTNWNTEIKSFNFSVTLPSDLVLEPETEYYAVWGDGGSKDRLKLEKIGNKIQNLEPLSLKSHQAVTIAVKFPEHYVPVEEFKEVVQPYTTQSHSHEKLEDWWFREEDRKEKAIAYTLLMIPILMVLVFLYFPLKYVFWILCRMFFLLFVRKRQEIRDIIYYTPPKELSVAEVAALYARCPTYDSIFSTFYSRYVRGLIVFWKNKWSQCPDFQRKKDVVMSGIGFEAMLWNIMFDRNTYSSFSIKKFQTRNISLKWIANSAFDKTKKFYTLRSLRVQGGISIKSKSSGSVPVIAFGIFIFSWLSIFMLLFMNKEQVILFFIGSVLFVLFLGIISSFDVIEYTPEGLELYEQVLGFRKYLKTVEEPKLKKLLEEDPHYFDKMLPYAVAFWMGTEWIDKCKVILKNSMQKSDFDDFEWRLWFLKDIQRDFDVLARDTDVRESRSSRSSGFSSDFGSDSGFDSDGWSSGGWGGWGGGWSW